MNKSVKILLLALICPLLAGAIMSSCSGESDCSIAGRPMLYATVYTYHEDTESWVAGELPTLTITAEGTDSVILNQATRVQYMTLPLQYAVDTTALVLHYSETAMDTIVIRHTNTPYFLSMECGYEMRQSIVDVESYTRNRIDEISIQNENTNTNGTENLRLHIRN